MAADFLLTEMLKAKIAYGSARQKVLAQNISSADTPGYKARDLQPLNFAQVLSQQSQASLAVTSNSHLNGLGAGASRFRSVELKDTFEITPTGNTVSVEEQMMKVAQNATDFQASVALYKKIGSLFRMALGQGGGSS